MHCNPVVLFDRWRSCCAPEVTNRGYGRVGVRTSVPLSLAESNNLPTLALATFKEGDNVVIGGFCPGTEPKRVIIREMAQRSINMAFP